MLWDIIQSLIVAIITLAGAIGFLSRRNKNNPGNNCKSLDKEFTAHQIRCNEKFMAIAEDRGEVKAVLKSIDTRLSHIETKLS